MVHRVPLAGRWIHPLSGFLTEAGPVVAEQFGDWERSPLTETGPEIITVARRRR